VSAKHLAMCAIYNKNDHWLASLYDKLGQTTFSLTTLSLTTHWVDRGQIFISYHCYNIIYLDGDSLTCHFNEAEFQNYGSFNNSDQSNLNE